MIKRGLAHVASSLGAQLALAVLISFSCIAIVGAWIVRSSVDPVFDEMERRNAYESIHRVMSAMQTELNSLQLVATNWASWNDLAYYMERGQDGRFIQNNLNPIALRKVGLTALVAWNNEGKLLLQEHNQEPGRGEMVMQRLSGIFQSLRTLGASGCGFLKMQSDVIELCWQRIAYTEQLDSSAGTLAVARVVSTNLWNRLSTETQQSLDVKPAVFRLAGEVSNDDLWYVAGLPSFAKQDVLFKFQPATLRLTVTVLDMRRIPLLDLHLYITRDLAQEASSMMWRILGQMGLGVLLVSLFAWLLVRWRFVWRVQRIRRQLGSIEASKDWGRGLLISGSDELARLAGHINLLLGIIYSQVQDLTSQTLTDALTGLPNRRALDARLRHELSSLQRRQSHLSVLMLDVDFFKQYNDHFGHPSGDEVLRKIARVLEQCCRTRDLAVRMGGEEFAVLLPETDAQGAMQVAQTLCQAVEALHIEHPYSNVSQWVTCSIGATTMLVTEWSEENFLRQADQALYAAKAASRNYSVHFKDLP